MAKDRPFTQYDQNIESTQGDNTQADSRPVPDNGTQGANFSVGGMRSVSKVDYPLPPDPHAPHGDDGDNDMNTSLEYGVDESKEVGHDGGPATYGLQGSGGGGNKRNTKE